MHLSKFGRFLIFFGHHHQTIAELIFYLYCTYLKTVKVIPFLTNIFSVVIDQVLIYLVMWFHLLNTNSIRYCFFRFWYMCTSNWSVFINGTIPWQLFLDGLKPHISFLDEFQQHFPNINITICSSWILLNKFLCVTFSYAHWILTISSKFVSSSPSFLSTSNLSSHSHIHHNQNNRMT